MANPSLPSFVELMASLGLQDEHAVNALIRGATAAAAADSATTPLSATTGNNNNHYPIVNTLDHRQSNPSIDTPLSSASLITPLSSPPPPPPPSHRERPTSHGKKRYSPYGLNAVSGTDIYTRRGSVPDILSQGHYGQDRRLHHLSAPEPYHDHDRASNSGRATDEDGDEEMEDASALAASVVTRPQLSNYKSPNTTSPSSSSSLHCAGQPNLLISRQRMPRPGHGQGVSRTKSHSHMRTTSIGASQRHSHQHQHQQQQLGQRPPMPSPNPRVDMSMDTERSNVNDEGDIAVVSISSLLRRSHPQSRPVNNANASVNGNGNPNATAAGAAATTTTTGPNPTVSLDSPRGFKFPQVPSLPPPQLPTSAVTSGSTSPSESLRPQQQPHRAPPSAPPTKTSFGFLPGASLGGQISLSAVRRARHARSSSARSVREMIREREGGVLLAPLHSFHPMGETEEERESGVHDSYSHSLKPSESSRTRHESTGQDSAHSTNTTDDNRGVTPPVQTSSGPSTLQAAGSHSSFLPLDDTSRSFSHRRRVKRHTTDTTTTTTRTGGKRSSPPPPLMLPTLPISFNIRALVGGDREGGNGDKDRPGGGEGYVSRREPHSPDPRGSWRRRVAPLEVAGV